MKVPVARVIAGAAVAACLRRVYRLAASGALTLDLDVGRRLQPLGPLVQTINAPPEVVFEVIAAPYLGRTPRALADKMQVWELGAWWGRRVARAWTSAVADSLREIAVEAERRGASHPTKQLTD